MVIGEPKLYQNMWCFTRIGEVCGVSLTVKNYVGEVSHTTECVTDLFSFVDV